MVALPRKVERYLHGANDILVQRAAVGSKHSTDTLSDISPMK